MTNHAYLQAKNPRAFISYSRDSAPHVEQIVALAAQLRSEGVDCIIDEYEPAPPQGWQQWMIDQISDSDFVLIICSKGYVTKLTRTVDPGVGLGVAWEGAVITQEVYQAGGHNSKFIPVLLASEDKSFVPQPLRSATYYDLSREDGYEKLYRRLTYQPEVEKPPLGPIRRLMPRYTPMQPSRTQSTDVISQLLRALGGGDWGVSSLRSMIPTPEQIYHLGSESPDFREEVYLGGDLRVYVDSNDTEVFSVAFPCNHPEYSTFVETRAPEGMWAFEAAPYVFLCRSAPVNELVYARIVGSELSMTEVNRLLGTPTYSSFLHGIGSRIYAYIPHGLVFCGWSEKVSLLRPSVMNTEARPTYFEYLRSCHSEAEDFCRLRTQRIERIRQAVHDGKWSPGGKYRAGVYSGGVYWENWIVIGQNGHADVLRQAPYFVADYEWLDEESVAFAVWGATETSFFAANVQDSAPRHLATVEAIVRSFSVPTPNLLLYKTEGGDVRQLRL